MAEAVGGEVVVPVPISRDDGIRMMALSMAIKHIESTMLRDGALYQQLKLDGREIGVLRANAVLEKAIDFERYLRGDYADMAAQIVNMDFEAWLKEQTAKSVERALLELDKTMDEGAD